MKNKHFKIEPLNIEKFIKVNELNPSSNPIFFDANGSPTTDGLLSNEIFGITKDDRANIFSYISLGKNEVFIHPLHYKIWTKMDSRIKECVHGTKQFIIKDGELVEDPNGSCGIEFLQKNFDKIKIKRTNSSRRDYGIRFLKDYKDTMFIKDMVVIPAFWRDVNSTGKYTGVGDINKIYSSLIIASKSLQESNDYGFNLSDSIRGRIQEMIVSLYDYFTKGTFNGQPVTGIAGKFGILKRSNLSKTTDYSSRLVITAPELKVENVEDMISDVDHVAVPLASLCANYYPFMIFYIRRFFDNTFAGLERFPVVYNDKTVEMTDIKDYQISFSDEKIKEEMDRFIHGMANRFRPIEVPLKNGKVGYLKLVGYDMTPERYTEYKDKGIIPDKPILDRKMTWCDLFFIAACEVVEDKAVLITRFPMDSYFNQFPSKVNVSSTKNTIPLLVNNKLYRFYPDIKEEDFFTNTTNRFSDSLKMCNAYLPSIGGDYDGDMVSCKAIYSEEANKELIEQMNSKAHYITIGCQNIVQSTNEGKQALYALSLVLPDDKNKLQKVEF